MRLSHWMMFSLAFATACERDINIANDIDANGVPNVPNLNTPVKHDRIVQVTTPKVDVLWVIDDSCSMSEEQQKLATNFPSFIEFFLDSGLDYHIGVVSTDTDAPNKRGRLQGAGSYRFIDPNTPNPVALFGQMATLGTGGAIDERGRRATQMALTDPQVNGYNAGFYRDEASLHVVIISDENDSSGSNPTRNEFINFLQTLKEDPELVTFSSVVGPQGGCATADPGVEYIAVTNAVGGIHESICAQDWVPVLEELGLQAAGLRREYFLSEIPVPGTLEVWVIDGDFNYEGVDQVEFDAADGDWDKVCPSVCFTYEYNAQRNSILMEDFVPSPLAEINIRYELLSGFQPDGEEDNPLLGEGEIADTDTDLP
jgi:hypothetical protein